MNKIPLFKKPEVTNTPELEELRRQRNDHEKIASDFQKQIDDKKKQLWQVPNIEGKWIVIDEEDDLTIGKVGEVFRLVTGIRINYSSCAHIKEQYITIGCDSMSSSYYLDSDNIPEFTIVDEATAKKMIKECVDGMVEFYHN